MKSRKDSKIDNHNILIIAAEASSCMYAKEFQQAWQSEYPQAQFFGVGDKEMANKGMDCLGYAEDMAVVGLQEVIKHFKPIRQVFHNILSETEKRKPKFALLLDYPGFNLRLAKQLKSLGIPVVYYISPQLWAWKKGRVKTVKQFVDEMLVVFPFEVDFYQEYGIKAHFVGHPLVEVVEKERHDIVLQRKAKPILGLMPGSRRSEIHNNFKAQLKAAYLLQQQFDLDVRVLLAPTLTEDDFTEYFGGTQEQVKFLKSSPTDMISQCDYIMSASGTATLQVSLCEKPMVVMYRMNPVTAFFAKLLVRSVDAFCIVNLIAGRKVVPELFQEEADAQGLADAMSPLIKDSSRRDKMITDLKQVNEKLGAGGATQNVVRFLSKRFFEK